MTVIIGRGELLAALGGATAAWPLAASAQPPPTPVIGFLSSASPQSFNLTAARALGVEMPMSLLLRADEVIE